MQNASLFSQLISRISEFTGLQYCTMFPPNMPLSEEAIRSHPKPPGMKQSRNARGSQWNSLIAAMAAAARRLSANVLAQATRRTARRLSASCRRPCTANCAAVPSCSRPSSSNRRGISPDDKSPLSKKPWAPTAARKTSFFSGDESTHRCTSRNRIILHITKKQTLVCSYF